MKEGNKIIRRRSQKNGQSQKSVLASILFNMYLHKQLIDYPDARHFIYTDDTSNSRKTISKK